MTQTMRSRTEAVDEMKAVWRIVASDIDAIVDYGKRNNTPCAQRSLVRAFFAAVEALSFQMRQVTLASLAPHNLLTLKELTLLNEVQYALDEKGRINEKSAPLQFPRNIFFTAAMYAKIHGATFALDNQSSGWCAFKEAMQLRNDVTHPKRLESLNPSDASLVALLEANRWWNSEMLRLFVACEKADEQWKAAQ